MQYLFLNAQKVNFTSQILNHGLVVFEGHSHMVIKLKSIPCN